MADEIDWNTLDPARAKLRALVTEIELQITGLQSSAGTQRETFTPLLAGWAKLVTELGLGPEPEVRRCPHCRLVIPRKATRCRYCMKHSPAAEAV